jgi:hypothetical protein
VFKAPAAASTGTGGRLFGIVPGRPDESILLHRIESVETGARMPELGRRIVDHDGVALIRRWIEEMAAER